MRKRKPNLSSFTDKLAPHDEEAEEHLLASILLHPEVLSRIEGLRPEHFSNKDYGEIYKSYLNLRDGGRSINLANIRLEIEERLRLPSDKLDEITDFLRVAAYNLPSTAFVEDHAGIIRSTAMRRRIISAAQQVATDAFNVADPMPTIAKGLEMLEALSDQLQGRSRRLEITSLLKVQYTDTPMYDVSVNGCLLRKVPWRVLKSPSRFRDFIAERLNFLPYRATQADWDQRLSVLLERMQQEEVPPDASEAGQVMMAIAKICRYTPPAETMDDMGIGRPAMINVRGLGEHYFFRSDQLMRLLRDKNGAHTLKVDELWAIMRSQGCLANHNFRLGNSQAKGWGMPATLVEGMEELGVMIKDEDPAMPTVELDEEPEEF